MPYLKNYARRADEPFLPDAPKPAAPDSEELTTEPGGTPGGFDGTFATLPAPTGLQPTAGYDTSDMEAALDALDSKSLVKQAIQGGAYEAQKALELSYRAGEDIAAKDVLDYLGGQSSNERAVEVFSAPAMDLTKVQAPEGQDVKAAMAAGGAQLRKVRPYEDITTDIFDSALKGKYVENAVAKLAAGADDTAKKQAKTDALAKYRRDLGQIQQSLKKGESQASMRDAKRYLTRTYSQSLLPGDPKGLLLRSARNGAGETLDLATSTIAGEVIANSPLIYLGKAYDWMVGARQDPSVTMPVFKSTYMEDEDRRGVRVRDEVQSRINLVYENMIRTREFNPKIKSKVMRQIEPLLRQGVRKQQSPLKATSINEEALRIGEMMNFPAQMNAGIISAESGGSPLKRAFNLHRMINDPAVTRSQKAQVYAAIKEANLVGGTKANPISAAQAQAKIEDKKLVPYYEGEGARAVEALYKINPAAVVRATAWGTYQVMGREGGLLDIIKENAKEHKDLDLTDDEAAEYAKRIFESPEDAAVFSRVLYGRWWKKKIDEDPDAAGLVARISENPTNADVGKLATMYHGKHSDAEDARNSWIGGFWRGYTEYTGVEPDAVGEEDEEEALPTEFAPSPAALREGEVRGEESTVVYDGPRLENMVGAVADAALPGSAAQTEAQARKAEKLGYNMVQVRSDAFDSGRQDLPAPGSVEGQAAAKELVLSEKEYDYNILDYADLGMGQGFRKLKQDLMEKFVSAAVREADRQRLTGGEREAKLQEARADAQREAVLAATSAQTAGLWTNFIITSMEDFTGVGGETWFDGFPTFIKAYASAIAPKIEVIGRFGNEIIYRQEGGGQALLSTFDAVPGIGQAFNAGVINNYIVPTLEEMGLSHEQAQAASPAATALFAAALPFSMSAALWTGQLDDIYYAGVAGVANRDELVQYGMKTMSAYAGTAAELSTPVLEWMDDRDWLSSFGPSNVTGQDGRVVAVKDTIRTAGSFAGMGIGLIGAVLHPDLLGGFASATRGASAANRALKARRVIRAGDVPTARRFDIFAMGVARDEVLVNLLERNEEVPVILKKLDPDVSAEVLTSTREAVVKQLEAADETDAGLRHISRAAVLEVDQNTGANLTYASEAGHLGATIALDAGHAQRLAELIRAAIKQGKASGDPARMAKAEELEQLITTGPMKDALDQISLSPAMTDRVAATSQSAETSFNTAARVDILLRTLEIVDDVELTEVPRQRRLAQLLSDSPITIFNDRPLPSSVAGTGKVVTVLPPGSTGQDLLGLFGLVPPQKLEEQLKTLRLKAGEDADEVKSALRQQYNDLAVFVDDLRAAALDGELLKEGAVAAFRERAITLGLADTNALLFLNSNPHTRGRNLLRVVNGILEHAQSVQGESGVIDTLRKGLAAVIAASSARSKALKDLARDRVDLPTPEAVDAFLDTRGAGTRAARVRSALVAGTLEGLTTLVRGTPYFGSRVFGGEVGTYQARMAKQHLARADGSDPSSFAYAMQQEVGNRIEARKQALLDAVGDAEGAEALRTKVRASDAFLTLTADAERVAAPEWRAGLVSWLYKAAEQRRSGEVVDMFDDLPVGVDIKVFSKFGRKVVPSRTTRKFLSRTKFFEAFGFAGETVRPPSTSSKKATTRRKRMNRREKQAMSVIIDQLAKGVTGVTDAMRPAEVEQRLGAFFGNVVNVQRMTSLKKYQESMKAEFATIKSTYVQRLEEKLGDSLGDLTGETPKGAWVTTLDEDGRITADWYVLDSVGPGGVTLHLLEQVSDLKLDVADYDVLVVAPNKVRVLGEDAKPALQGLTTKTWREAVDMSLDTMDPLTAAGLFDMTKAELKADIDAQLGRVAAGGEVEPQTAHVFLQEDAAGIRAREDLQSAEVAVLAAFDRETGWLGGDSTTLAAMRTPEEAAQRVQFEARIEQAAADGVGDETSRLIKEMLASEHALHREVAEHNLEVALTGLPQAHLPAVVREDPLETMLRVRAYRANSERRLQGQPVAEGIDEFLRQNDDFRRYDAAREQYQATVEEASAVQKAADAPIPAAKTPEVMPDLPSAERAAIKSPEEVAEALRLWSTQGEESPYFTRWSGGLPVVGDNAKPPPGGFVLRGFHGTKRHFAAFDPAADARVPPGGRGIYITPYADHATKYAYGHDKRGRYIHHPDARVLPLYLRLKNPLRGDAPVPPTFLASYRQLAAERGVDITGVEEYLSKWVDVSDPRYLTALVVDFAGLNETRSKLFNDAMLLSGHDGFVLQYADGSIREAKGILPNQVKSATGNRGTFSSDDARHLYQKDDLGTLADRALDTAVQSGEYATAREKYEALSETALVNLVAKRRLKLPDMPGASDQDRGVSALLRDDFGGEVPRAAKPPVADRKRAVVEATAESRPIVDADFNKRKAISTAEGQTVGTVTVSSPLLRTGGVTIRVPRTYEIKRIRQAGPKRVKPRKQLEGVVQDLAEKLEGLPQQQQEMLSSQAKTERKGWSQDKYQALLDDLDETIKTKTQSLRSKMTEAMSAADRKTTTRQLATWATDAKRVATARKKFFARGKTPAKFEVNTSGSARRFDSLETAQKAAETAAQKTVKTESLEQVPLQTFLENLKDKYRPVAAQLVRQAAETGEEAVDIAKARAANVAVAGTLTEEDLQALLVGMRESKVMRRTSEEGVAGLLDQQRVSKLSGMMEDAFGFYTVEDEILSRINILGRVSKDDLEALNRPDLDVDEEVVEFLRAMKEKAPEDFDRMAQHIEQNLPAQLEEIDVELKLLARKVKAQTKSLEKIKTDQVRRRRVLAIEKNEERIKQLTKLREEYAIEDVAPPAGGAGQPPKPPKTPTPVTVEETPDPVSILAKGMTRFVDEARAIITAFADAEASTGLHELAHVARRHLGDDQQEKILKWVNSKLRTDGKKLVSYKRGTGGVRLFYSDDIQSVIAAEEMFARGFERYLREGVVPTNRLRSAFRTMKEVLTRVYSAISGTGIDVSISAEMYDLFDEMFGAQRQLSIDDVTDVALFLDAQEALQRAGKEARATRKPRVKGQARYTDADRIVEQSVTERTFIDRRRQLRASVEDYKTRGVGSWSDLGQKQAPAQKAGRTVGPGSEGTGLIDGRALGPISRRVMTPQEVGAAVRGDKKQRAKFKRWSRADHAAVAAAYISTVYTRSLLFGDDHARLLRSVNAATRNIFTGPERELEELVSETSLLLRDISATSGPAREAAISRLINYMLGPDGQTMPGGLLGTGARRSQKARQNFVNTSAATQGLVNHFLELVNDAGHEALLADVKLTMADLIEGTVDRPVDARKGTSLGGFWKGYSVTPELTGAETVLQDGLVLRSEVAAALGDLAGGSAGKMAMSEFQTDMLQSIYRAISGTEVPAAGQVPEYAQRLAALMIFATGRGEVVKNGVTLTIDNLVPSALSQNTKEASRFIEFVYYGGTLTGGGQTVKVKGLSTGAIPPGRSPNQILETLLMMHVNGATAGILKDYQNRGFALSPREVRAFNLYQSGNAELLTAAELEKAMELADQYGFVKFEASPVANSLAYIPTNMRVGMMKQLQQAERQFGQTSAKGSRVLSALQRGSGWVLAGIIFGNVFGRQAFKIMSTQDQAYQLGLVVGGEAGVAAASRSFALTFLTGIGGERAAEIVEAITPKQVVQGLHKKLGNEAAVQALKMSVRDAVVKNVDELVHKATAFMGQAKYRVEVASIMDNTDDVFVLGGSAYKASDLRREFTRAGLYSNAYKEVRYLLSRDFNEQKYNTKELSEKDVKSLLQDAGASDANLDFFEDFIDVPDSKAARAARAGRRASSTLLEHGLESADAWSDLERSGGAVTLMEMGFKPYDAAKLMVEAVYDYRGSMGEGDRHWLRKFLMPFWAFRKNANIQFANLAADPATAFRMMALSRATRWAPTALTYVIYETFLEPYDVNVDGMNATQKDFYYNTRAVFEYGYGDVPTAETLESYREELPDKLSDMSDEALLDHSFNGWTIREGFKGYPGVPADMKMVMRAMLSGRGAAATRRDGNLYDLQTTLTDKKERDRFVQLGRDVYVQQGPSRAGLALWAAKRPGVQVPWPVLEESATEIHREYIRQSGRAMAPGLSFHFILPDTFIQAASEMTAAAFLVPLVTADVIAGDSDRRMLLNAMESLVDVRGHGGPVLDLIMKGTEALVGLEGNVPKERLHPLYARVLEGTIGLPLSEEGAASRSSVEAAGAKSLMVMAQALAMGTATGEVFAHEPQGGMRTYSKRRDLEVSVDPETGERTVTPQAKILGQEYINPRDPAYAYQPYLYGTAAILHRHTVGGAINKWMLDNWDDSTPENVLETSKSFQNFLLNLAIEISRASGIKVVPNDPNLAAMIDRPRDIKQ